MGVDSSGNKDEGAGDQGIMFGYACNETDVLMPAPIHYSHRILRLMAEDRKSGKLKGIEPDSKSQITIEYKDGVPNAVKSVVISTQHSKDIDLAKVKELCMPYIERSIPKNLLGNLDEKEIYINPTGNFVIGGPDGDSGLTGRKIIVDTYGGAAPHGGGAFSGKDPSKVDRSAAYAARHIAKNLVAAGVSHECLVQVSYAIGVSEPMAVYVNTYGTSKIKFSDNEISKIVSNLFDLRPYFIERRLKLRSPIYKETSAYGHMGRKPEIIKKKFVSSSGELKEIEVELFTWEKLDYVNKIKELINNG